MVPLSVLDLCPVTVDSTPGQALRNTLSLAQLVDQLGYQRYWLAEHHNMPGIASAATSVVISQVAAVTSRMRVGAGGIMLPNHSPLVIAEQFGTLAALFPDRIDLGVGRAPGTDQMTAHALRRTLAGSVDQFPQDVLELIGYFADEGEGRRVRAYPGAGEKVPVWILGSSLYGAQLAAMLGLPYSFASHFAPEQLMPAIELYRREFRPSPHLEQPYVMLGYNVFAADSDDEGEYLASSMQQSFVNLRRGDPGRMQPPVENYFAQLGPADQALLKHVLSCTAAGSPKTIARQMREFIERTSADELILNSQIYSHEARLKCYSLVAEAWTG